MRSEDDSVYAANWQGEQLPVAHMLFDGVFTLEQARKVSEEWESQVKAFPGKKWIMVWDCQQMTNYEPLARGLFQRMLLDNKKSVQHIFLITDSMIIKAGAKLLSMFTGLQLSIHASQEEVKKKLVVG
ncbi:MAG: hypothetical protein MUF42_13135 [Cytophagaceae bacterium]|jgi:hypothetical protein|nr:hypothetical protein [Cytophagaceae bacterium]